MNTVVISCNGNRIPLEILLSILTDPEIIDTLFKPEMSSMMIVEGVVLNKDGPLGKIIIAGVRATLEELGVSFENDLATIIKCRCSDKCPKLDCIRVFVSTIGLQYFSGNFQTLWQEIHPN